MRIQAEDSAAGVQDCGRGDYTAEKQARPPRTKAEMDAMLEKIKARARERGEL